jgi:hypothetical protein
MSKKEDLKDWLNDAVETANVPGTDYYGAEPDEAEVNADRERMEKATRTDDDRSEPAPA